jgi:hypothetical protein
VSGVAGVKVVTALHATSNISKTFITISKFTISKFQNVYFLSSNLT